MSCHPRPGGVQSFFETHEADAYVLKHDKQLSKQPQRSRHLRHLPDYLKQGVAAAAPRGSARRGLKRKLKPQDDPLKARLPRSPVVAQHGVGRACECSATQGALASAAASQC